VLLLHGVVRIEWPTSTEDVDASSIVRMTAAPDATANENLSVLVGIGQGLWQVAHCRNMA